MIRINTIKITDFLSQLKARLANGMNTGGQKYPFTELQLSQLLDQQSVDIKFNMDSDFIEFNDDIDMEDVVRKLYMTVQDYCTRTISKDNILDRITDYAKRHSCSPIKQMFDSRKWKGDDYSGWLFHCLKLEDTEYNRKASLALAVNLAARALAAGCNVDQMFIFKGEQNIGKSYLLECLVGRDYFVRIDRLNKFDVNRTAELLVGKLVAEFGELNIQNTDIDMFKHFITLNEDTYRKVYTSDAKPRKRNCILISTTNNDAVFNDPTGNRRYILIEALNKKNEQLDFISYINRNREQILAFAAAKYKELGVQHLPLPKEMEEKYSYRPPYTDDIEEIIESFGQELVTTAEIRRRFLMNCSKPLNDGVLSKAMQHLKYKRERKGNKRFWIKA